MKIKCRGARAGRGRPKEDVGGTTGSGRERRAARLAVHGKIAGIRARKCNAADADRCRITVGQRNDFLSTLVSDRNRGPALAGRRSSHRCQTHLGTEDKQRSTKKCTRPHEIDLK